MFKTHKCVIISTSQMPLKNNLSLSYSPGWFWQQESYKLHVVRGGSGLKHCTYEHTHNRSYKLHGFTRLSSTCLIALDFHHVYYYMYALFIYFSFFFYLLYLSDPCQVMVTTNNILL